MIELEQRIALIACGQRPGKTRACDSCSRKGSGLLNIASAGAADAVAAAICGTGRAPTCTDCGDKALEIVRVYADEAE
ncbi:hypothetical protein ACFCWY_08825 [Streptomyces sp. NPDC056362]|uniref:hypothetical protein n=1 Tax=unclassified Streptomyces TaxID=2593676 RepID=UPI0035DDD6AE